MRRIKNLEPDRCPWCGEFLPRSPRVFIDIRNIKHSSCGKWCMRWRMPLLEMLMFWGVGLIIVVVSWILDVQFAVAKWIVFFWACVCSYYYVIEDSYIRIMPDDKWWKEPPAEPMIGKVDIRWYTMKEGGIGLPRIRITNDRIFVVCLVDKEGVPVSQTICVRLRRLFLGYWKATKVFLISDDLWKEDANGASPWEKAEKVLIYNKREVIGEGVIRR